MITVLADHFAGVVQRSSGTVDEFTGDGIMALFGAPIAPKDHAFRACLAASAVSPASCIRDIPRSGEAVAVAAVRRMR